jgi:PhnB protein
MHLEPYLDFNGRCDEALEFYKKAIGAEVELLMRWKDSPDKSMCTPQNAEKVMHSRVRIGDTRIMASDGRGAGKPNFQGIMLSLSANTEADADRLFNGLVNGGQVTMPLGKTFFSPRFGMVTDKFGVGWMILVAN